MEKNQINGSFRFIPLSSLLGKKIGMIMNPPHVPNEAHKPVKGTACFNFEKGKLVGNPVECYSLGRETYKVLLLVQ